MYKLIAESFPRVEVFLTLIWRLWMLQIQIKLVLARIAQHIYFNSYII